MPNVLCYTGIVNYSTTRVLAPQDNLCTTKNSLVQQVTFCYIFLISKVTFRFAL